MASAQSSAPPATTADNTAPPRVIISKLHPQDSRGEVVYSQETDVKEGDQVVSGTFVTPRLLHQTEPKYPKSMRRQKTEGNVTLEGVVTPEGTLIDLSVYKTAVPQDAISEASDNAIKAVRSYRFAPATLDGKPVAMLVRISVQFRIF